MYQVIATTFYFKELFTTFSVYEIRDYTVREYREILTIDE